jgi:PBSX family phage terminase large subunit
MSCWHRQNFAICGKTITSVKRNVLDSLLVALKDYGFKIEEKISKNYVDIELARVRNRFHIFGGKDEASAALIQGMTLAGLMLDEIVLMPRSFAEQAIARCSATGSKLWFNCNPANPYHWFYREYIQKCKEKNLLYLHFTMDDNPSLAEEIKARYRQMFTGSFYDRFVLGKWVNSSGLVYPMFDEKIHVFSQAPTCERYVISGDYGTVNPCSLGLWGQDSNGIWYRLREYYYDSRKEGISRTDEEHYSALENIAENLSIEMVIIDPSAASFIECIRRHEKFNVRKAQNDVISGINRVADALRTKKIFFHFSCKDTLREFSLYQWNEKSAADVPLKENDHAMDDLRYFVTAISAENTSNDFFAGFLNR